MTESNHLVQRVQYQGLETIKITGPFDVHGPEVEEAIRQVLDEGATSIVFDLSQTTYLTSPGIALIIKSIKWFTAVNGSVCLTGATQDILEFLSLARIDRYVKFI
jgi:anti-anti-sigma factor